MKKKIPKSFSLSEEAIELLKKVDNASKLVEDLVWEHFAKADSKMTIIQSANLKDRLENEIDKLENDALFIKARHALEAVEKPEFSKSRPLGSGIIPAKSKENADYFTVGIDKFTDIAQFDKYAAEKDTNAKIVKGYRDKIAGLKAELERVKREMKAMVRY